MKIKCINDNGCLYLTTGKFYEVIKIDDEWYLIINDISDKYWYPKEYFKLLSEIRIEKIDKLINY
jgi:hypothetical protein